MVIEKRIWRDSNPRHMVPETIALSPELQMRTCELPAHFDYYTTLRKICKEKAFIFHGTAA